MPQQTAKNADGTYKKVDPKDMKFDRLADGREVYKRLPGSYDRNTVADQRNYRDGDFMSSLEAGYGKEADSAATDYSIYNSPKTQFIVDDKGRVILQKDNKQRTTRVSNTVRVVKGGSWLDTAYWLDPGQRRYRDESKSFGWVGFRVAQDAKDGGTKRTKR